MCMRYEDDYWNFEVKLMICGDVARIVGVKGGYIFRGLHAYAEGGENVEMKLYSMASCFLR